MQIYQTVLGEPIELELLGDDGCALDLSLYDEDESFLRLEYPTATVDKAIRFAEDGNKVYYDVVEGDFDEGETVLGQIFMIKVETGVVTRRKPLPIFNIEVLRILEAP